MIERELIKDMKLLLECTSMGGLQRNADVLIGRAIELLAQPEPRRDSHCYWCDGEYDAGARLAQLTYEPVAWMYDWEDTIEKVSMQNRMTRIKAISERPEALNVRPLYTAPKRESLSEDEIKNIAEKVNSIYTLTSTKSSVGISAKWILFAKFLEQKHGIGL